MTKDSANRAGFAMSADWSPTTHTWMITVVDGDDRETSGVGPTVPDAVHNLTQQALSDTRLIDTLLELIDALSDTIEALRAAPRVAWRP